MIIQRNGNCSVWKAPSCLSEAKRPLCAKVFTGQAPTVPKPLVQWAASHCTGKNSLTETVHTELTSVSYPLTLWTGGKKKKVLEVQGVRSNIKNQLPTHKSLI